MKSKNKGDNKGFYTIEKMKVIGWFLLIILIIYIFLKNELLKLWVWLFPNKPSNSNVNLTYDEQAYKDYAYVIKDSFGWLGAFDDEERIYDVFRNLNTIEDLKMLLFWYNELIKRALPRALHASLDLNEIDEINIILFSKGIKYKF